MSGIKKESLAGYPVIERKIRSYHPRSRGRRRRTKKVLNV